VKTTGDRLRELRTSRNLSQAQVAEYLGIKPSTYCKYETDENRPVRKLKELSELFHVPADYIMCLSDNPFVQLMKPDNNSALGRAVAKAKQSYYHDPKVSAIVDELKNRPGMRILFDASRDLSEEDIRFVVQLVERMKRGKSDE